MWYCRRNWNSGFEYTINRCWVIFGEFNRTLQGDRDQLSSTYTLLRNIILSILIKGATQIWMIPEIKCWGIIILNNLMFKLNWQTLPSPHISFHVVAGLFNELVIQLNPNSIFHAWLHPSPDLVFPSSYCSAELI